MPESPFDDPFAELFGKLPDPRTREQATPPAPASPAPTPSGDVSGAPTTASTPAAPGSRRAAREAAARLAATGEQTTQAAAPAAPAGSSPVVTDRPVADGSWQAASAVPVQETYRPEPATAVQPEMSPASGPIGAVSFDDVISPRTSGQAAEAPASDPFDPADLDANPDETDPAEAWLLAGASRAGAVRAVAARTEPVANPSYARTGGVPQVRSEREPASSSPPSLEDLFSTANAVDPEDAEPKKRRRRRIGGWIALGVILVILGGIAGGAWYVWTTYEDRIREVMGWEEPKDYEAGMATGETLVTISAGDVPSTISRSLYDAGVTKTPEAFYDMLIDTAQNPTFYPGVYRLQQQMTSEAALTALQDPANKLEHSALLREGLTVEQSIATLAESLGIPIEDFQAAIANPADYGVTVDPAIVAAGGQPLEGWLFPAMYTFDPGATAHDVIATLVNRTVESLDAAGVPVEDRQRILTIASIIQREARYEADMQKVSRVIQNRLDPGNQQTFGLLQMDSTAQYGYGEMHDGTASTSTEAQTDDNPWNTYVRAGLPIGPISNPGDTAIASAMSPADGDWLYFVTVNLDTGETVFTSNVDDHNRAVAQWQAWCVDHPDSGC